MEKVEDIFQELVLSFCLRVPGIELRLSGLVASAVSLAQKMPFLDKLRTES